MPTETGQGKRGSFLGSHLSVQKSWDRLDLGITVRNLFNTARFKVEYYQPSYYSIVENYHGGLSLRCTLSYKLTGNYKEKQQKQLIEEDDNDMNGMY